MLAGFQGLDGERIMRIDRRGDDHRLDGRVGQDPGQVGGDSSAGHPAAKPGQPFSIQVADPAHLDVVVIPEDA
jgi:hypothetical protein